MADGKSKHPETQSKQTLRVEMRARRNALTATQQRQHAAQLRDRVSQLPWFQAAQAIALYCANDGEIDPGPLRQLCWEEGKAVYLPCISGSDALEFRCYQPGDRLADNRFGIPEPEPQAKSAEVGEMDLILAPLVAFSPTGDRLGMGGGFYDRALEQLPRPGNTPYLLGVAHNCQRVECLPADNRDVAMHGIATESAFIRC